LPLGYTPTHYAISPERGIRQHIMRFPRNRPNPPRRAGVGGQSRLPWGAEPPIASTSSQLVFTYSQLAFTYSGKRRAGRSSWTNAPMFNRQFRFIILDTRPTWPLNAMLEPTSNTRTLWRVTKCHQPGSSGSSDGQDVPRGRCSEIWSHVRHLHNVLAAKFFYWHL